MTYEDLPNRLALTLDAMLVRACLCRYPRFRATCERDTKDVGARGYTTWEQVLLVGLFESKTHRVDKKTKGQNHETGRCGTCGAHYERKSEEFFRDAWLEHLTIRPVLADIGASHSSAFPHCCPFYAAGPHGRNDELHLLNLHFPQLPVGDWLA